MDNIQQTLKTRLCIIGSGLASQTAAIYAAQARLKPLLFEGWMGNDLAPADQPTTTYQLELIPGFPKGMDGVELTDNFRSLSALFGTEIFTETVTKVDFSETPFKIFGETKTVLADSVIVATDAVPKRLAFPGSNEFWKRGISFCNECDGAARIFRNKPLAVIGGGNSAMEEARDLALYGSKVYIIHRRDEFRASKIMQNWALANPIVEVLWNSVVTEAYGEKVLEGLKVKNVVSGEVTDLKSNGLFLAIGHEPVTKFLDGQLELDAEGYVVTKPGTTHTSVKGVFAAGDVQDKKYRKAITAAATGCMAALDAEHYLEEIGAQEEMTRNKEEKGKAKQVRWSKPKHDVNTEVDSTPLDDVNTQFDDIGKGKDASSTSIPSSQKRPPQTKRKRDLEDYGAEKLADIGKGKDTSSTSIPSSQKRSQTKRKCDLEHYGAEKLAEGVKEVALAIKELNKNQLVVSDLYDEVMKTEEFDDITLANVFDYLVQNEMLAKAFLAKNASLRKIWIRNWIHQHGGNGL